MSWMLGGYLDAAALLAIGYGIVRLGSALKPLDSRYWLRLGQGVFLASLLLPGVCAFLPRESLPRPAVQVWSGVRSGHASGSLLLTSALGRETGARGGWSLSLSRAIAAEQGMLLLIVAGLVVGFGVYGVRLFRLRRVLGRAVIFRRIGRVRVVVTEEHEVPFSAWLPGGGQGVAYVAMPLGLLPERREFAIALRHELQHHRQGDTRWVHLGELVRAAFFWNPAARAWGGLLERFQELSCDEALLGRGGVSARDYASCLYRVAQQALNGASVLPAGTAGMAGTCSGHFLKRRIEMLFVENKKSSPAFKAAFWVCALALLGGSAVAARAAVRTRALSLKQAQAWVDREPGGTIPITVNELVLERLNRYVGTPEGRDYIKGCFARMPLYRAMIEGKIAAASFPAELLAMPMQESCFRNDLTSPQPYRARGIWQFIAPTAAHYGLKLDDHVDERLDPEKETDAAIAYLKDLKAQFGDWRLAIKGYNEGEKWVQALIDEHHTRDPWALEELSTTEHYLPGVMAMMIILKDPRILE